MARRRTRREPKPRHGHAAGYAISRVDGVIRIVPRALSGPGQMGRYGAGILASVAVVLMGGWVWLVEPFGTRAPGSGPPAWFVWLCPGGFSLLLAAVLFLVAAKLWWFRNTPLLIDPTGRVRYGRRELIPAGSAKAVRLDRTVRSVTDSGTSIEEVEVSLVYVEGSDGQFTALPEPYFSGFDGWAAGEELVKALAAALSIPVSIGPVPGANPMPGRGSGTDQTKHHL